MHDGTDALLHVGSVAGSVAAGTKGFLVAVGTVVETLGNVVLQLPALRTVLELVALFAVQVYHEEANFLFFFYLHFDSLPSECNGKSWLPQASLLWRSFRNFSFSYRIFLSIL